MVILYNSQWGNRAGVVNKHMWQQRDTYFNHECFCNKYFIIFHAFWNKTLHQENDKSWFYHTSWLKKVSMVFYLSYNILVSKTCFNVDDIFSNELFSKISLFINDSLFLMNLTLTLKAVLRLISYFGSTSQKLMDF